MKFEKLLIYGGIAALLIVGLIYFYFQNNLDLTKKIIYGGITKEACNSVGAEWVECGNRCEIENQGKPGVACAQMCESLCRCGGFVGIKCPIGYFCHYPANMMDAFGYCEELK